MLFRKNKKEKKSIKTFSKEKFDKMLKICLISFVIVSLISAFSSSFVLFALTVLCIVLTVLVIKRKPPEELPEHLCYCAKYQIDIEPLPEEYRKKLISIYSVLYNDAKHNNKLVIDGGDLVEESENSEK